MRTIFDAGRQRWKIWFVVLLSLLCGGVLIWLGGYLLQNYGLDPADGGVLKPLMTRILLGGAFALFGAAIVAGILAYLRCYVTRIEADDAGSGFRITLAGPSRSLSVHPDDVVRAGFHEGRSHAGGISVNAPWYSVRLRGRRLPLIVDLQGDFLDQSAVDRLIEGEPAPVLEPVASGKGKKRR
ncbi:MAG TPA: hypothetical protein VFS20_20110 [Longimicrobium sp.]|nr:hypothetical protein [Longimicrobium sp.]